jgi:hypothetical protein
LEIYQWSQFWCVLSVYLFPWVHWKVHALQRHNTENSKPIFPEKELHSLSPNFHIHGSVSDLFIWGIGGAIFYSLPGVHICPNGFILRWNSWTSIWKKTQIAIALHSPSSGFTENHTLLWFLKSMEKMLWSNKTWVFSWIAFCWTEILEQKITDKLESEKARVYAQKPWLKMPFENSISGYPFFPDFFSLFLHV